VAVKLPIVFCLTLYFLSERSTPYNRLTNNAKITEQKILLNKTD